MGVAATLFILLAAILFIIASISVFKLHPFLGLLLVSLGTGLAFGLPLQQLVGILTGGFGDILAYIGLVIVLGSILGELLEKSGGAEVIARSILQTIGRKNPQLALSTLGAVVGVPVFCDTGFIILSGLTQSIARTRGLSAKRLSVGLAAGLYTTHTLIPPTPGPIAAAGNLGASDYLGLVMLVGLLVSIPVVLVAYWGSRRMRFGELEMEAELEQKGASELATWRAYLPLLIPIVFIAIGTTAQLMGVSGWAGESLRFMGNPVVALLLAVFVGFAVLRVGKMTDFRNLVGSGIMQSGSVLIITGAGGAFGAVLKASSLTGSLEQFLSGFQGQGAFFLIVAFLLAALLKTSQGSSTSAIVITSSMLAPLLSVVGVTTPWEISLLVMAIGGGAMTVSHANDSFFWVVSQFGGLSVKEAYRSFTLVTALQGLTVLMVVLLLSLF